MKVSQAIEIELERIRRETTMKAEAFYQEYNITPDKKKDNCVFDQLEKEVLDTLFSNKTSNLY